MVTKGYQKGVYKWVTLGISGGTGGYGPSLVQKRYLAAREQSVIFRLRFEKGVGSRRAVSGLSNFDLDGGRVGL